MRRYAASRAHSGQRGIALLTALILVAIATVLATAIGFASIMAARRASTVFGADQSLLVAEGAEAIEANLLKQNGPASQSDSIDQLWAHSWDGIPVFPGVVLEHMQLEDEQGKFNLNDLAADGTDDQEAINIFQRLLTNLGLEPKWAGLIADWIDADTVPYQPDGAEDSEYLSQTPQYRPPNQPLTSISELLALPGFGRQRFDRLAPYITALPPGVDSKPINLCTAPGPVLDALSGESAYSNDPTSLRNNRLQNGCVPTTTVFNSSLTRLSADEKSKVTAFIGMKSHYFRLHTIITIGTARFTLYSLLQRDDTGQIRPILRTFGKE